MWSIKTISKDDAMKIVMLMAGFGRRFSKAGYSDIKPLIKIAGKPMVEHSIGNFPGEEFIFVCSNEHLKKTKMEGLLKKLKPGSTIIGINPQKDDPVGGFIDASDRIPDDEEIIVSYPDLKLVWDYQNFLKSMRDGNFDCALPIMTGFHPAFTTGGRFCTVITDDDKIPLSVKPKLRSFTGDEKNQFADSGTYYFRKGSLAKKYAMKVVDLNIVAETGQRYFSSISDLMIKDKLKVTTYALQKYICLGTPEDIEQYEFWHNAFKNKENKKSADPIFNYWQEYFSKG